MIIKLFVYNKINIIRLQKLQEYLQSNIVAERWVYNGGPLSNVDVACQNVFFFLDRAIKLWIYIWLLFII